MNIDFVNTETWKEIPTNRKEALCYVFGLYCVSIIPETTIEVLKNNYSFEYQLGQCHLNSILFANLYTKQYDCYLVEGIAINAKGEAFMHCWNKFRFIPNSEEKQQEEECDITHDLLMPGEKPFLYYKTMEYNIKNILNGTQMSFDAFTQQKLKEYLTIIPDAKPKM